MVHPRHQHARWWACRQLWGRTAVLQLPIMFPYRPRTPFPCLASAPTPLTIPHSPLPSRLPRPRPRSHFEGTGGPMITLDAHTLLACLDNGGGVDGRGYSSHLLLPPCATLPHLQPPATASSDLRHRRPAT